MGPEKTPFDVHVALLCDYSHYFYTIFTERAKSGVLDDLISLPDVNPDVFAEAVSWMYRGAFSPDIESGAHITFLVQLWVLAGTFQIPELQEAAFSACENRIESKSDAVTSAETINFIYAHTTPGSLPRKLVVNTWVRGGTPEEYARHKDNFPREFLEELCAEFIAGFENTVGWVPGQAKNNIPLPQFFAQDPAGERLLSRQ